MIFDAGYKTFTYSRNKSGPRIESCDTPQLIFKMLDFVFLLMIH